ncbi:MAG: hypothetical protein K2K73_00370, partial [Ureaplasma sp.]|nr:hypothetical protein [Ureaplasma sp.]
MNNTWWNDSSKESNDSSESINDQQSSNVNSENTHTHTDTPDSLITTKGSHFEENKVAKKQKNKKLAIILTSVLSATALGVATFALIRSCSTQYNLKNENLLFTQRDIQNYKTKVEKNDWTKEEFQAEITSDSLTDFTKLNLLVENKTISNLIVDVLPLQPNTDDTQNIEVRLKTQKDDNGNELNNYYKLDINVDENLAELKNNNLVLKNIDVNFIRGVQISQLDKLYNEINNYISLPSYKFTKSEFKNHIASDQNKDLLKNMIVSNLYVSEFQRLDINQIKSVEFDSDKLIIELSPEFNQGEYVKFLIQTNPNFYLEKKSENYVLYINNLKFWTDVAISPFDLNNLSKKIQEFINLEMNQFNVNEFINQLNTPMFKNAIAQYLNIYSDKIGQISYENDSLKINPSSYVKFTCSELNSYLTNDYIEISNALNFYTTTNIINLSILYNKLNEYIKDPSRKLTAVQFLETIQNNKQLIKNLIIDNLYV